MNGSSDLFYNLQVFKKRLYYCMVSLSQAKKCQQGGFSAQSIIPSRKL
jgi:hypothetical protein